jgi:putative ferrous iron transport protein C
MMLLQLKSYLMAKEAVTLEELAMHFDEDPNVIQDMLEHFIRKGQVIKKVPNARCDACTITCGLEHLSVYQWQEKQE